MKLLRDKETVFSGCSSAVTRNSDVGSTATKTGWEMDGGGWARLMGMYVGMPQTRSEGMGTRMKEGTACR